jgi:hypothetical protein
MVMGISVEIRDLIGFVSQHRQPIIRHSGRDPRGDRSTKQTLERLNRSAVRAWFCFDAHCIAPAKAALANVSHEHTPRILHEPNAENS